MQIKPVWTAKHDAIVAEYEQRVKEGKVKDFVIITRKTFEAMKNV